MAANSFKKKYTVKGKKSLEIRKALNHSTGTVKVKPGHYVSFDVLASRMTK